MRVRTAFAAAVSASILCASAPASAQHEIANDHQNNPVYNECRREGVNDNQCYCYSQWIYNNGWEVNKQVVVRIMQAYPLTSEQSFGEEIWEKTGLSLSRDDMIAAVDLIVNATSYCSKWENK